MECVKNKKVITVQIKRQKMETRKSRRGGSLVWKHVVRLSHNRVKCRYCLRELSMSTTANLFRHFKAKHRALDLENPLSPANTSRQQPYVTYENNDSSSSMVETIIKEDGTANSGDGDKELSYFDVSEYVTQKKSALGAFFDEENFEEKSTPDPPRLKRISDLLEKSEVHQAKHRRTPPERTAAPAPAATSQTVPTHMTASVPHFMSIPYPAMQSYGSDIGKVEISEFDAIGKNVAFKLAKMSDSQLMYAETLINTILRRGVMNSLSEETKLCEGVCKNRPIKIVAKTVVAQYPSSSGKGSKSKYQLDHEKAIDPREPEVIVDNSTNQLDTEDTEINESVILDPKSATDVAETEIEDVVAIGETIEADAFSELSPFGN